MKILIIQDDIGVVLNINSYLQNVWVKMHNKPNFPVQ